MPQYDVFFPALGPTEYIAILRRTQNEKPRPMKAIAPEDPWQEHGVYLMAKGNELTAWAHIHFDPAIASHVERFMRTRDPRELRTLTDLERQQLSEKARELQIPLKKGGRFRL